MLGILCSQLFWSQAVSNENNADSWLRAKNFYFTYLLSENANINSKLSERKDVQPMIKQRLNRFIASKNCKDKNCYISAFKWTDSEISGFMNAVSNLYDKDKDLQNLVGSQLLPSKTYGNNSSVSPKDYMKKAMLQDLTTMNYIIDVYGDAKQPNYPKIDSISFDIKNKNYPALLNGIREEMMSNKKVLSQPLYLTLTAAERLLEINDRWDAGQQMLLQEKENAEAVRKVKSTDFSKFTYSAILTLGAGPEVAGQKISPMGMLRARTAANHYFQGVAPFIILSGGRVHPYKTVFTEALEMKKYLVENLNVPAEAIIIEPLARHTTTNYRNAIRLMLAYGFPKDKMAVATSSASHLDAVQDMESRLLKELGYMPYVPGKRVAETLLEFKPLDASFTIDPDEPLDP